MKITLVVESKSKDVYFDTYSAAVQHAIADAEKQGYHYNEDEYFRIVNTGSRKPSGGGSTRWSLPLYKSGKSSSSVSLHVQVFDRGLKTTRNNYELNHYIL